MLMFPAPFRYYPIFLKGALKAVPVHAGLLYEKP